MNGLQSEVTWILKFDAARDRVGKQVVRLTKGDVLGAKLHNFIFRKLPEDNSFVDRYCEVDALEP